MSLLRPISTLNPWQKCKLRDRDTGLYVGGYVVVGHDMMVEVSLDNKTHKFSDSPGATVVCSERHQNGAKGQLFMTVRSTAMVELDE